MKITFLSPVPNLSGGQRVNAIYAERLQARGHEVTVVARKRKQPRLAQHIKSLLKLQRPRSISEISHFDDIKAGLKLIDRAGPLLAQDLPDADVVVATWWETAFIAAQLPPEKGKKFYFVQGHEIHNSATKHLSSGSYFLPLKKITVAGWLRDLMGEKYGDHDVALVPNSVDQDLFYGPERGKQSSPTVGLMYTTRPVKGLEPALKTLERVARQIPDLKIVAFGADPENSSFPLLPNSEFHLRPDRDQLRRLYGSCDAFLFSGRYEGFGLTVLEAMACRTPVVGTRTGCAPDAIIDGINGYLADIDDADGLAQGLIKVLTAPEDKWRALSKAAHDYTEHYSWDDATDLFEQALLAP